MLILFSGSLRNIAFKENCDKLLYPYSEFYFTTMNKCIFLDIFYITNERSFQIFLSVRNKVEILILS